LARAGALFPPACEPGTQQQPDGHRTERDPKIVVGQAERLLDRGDAGCPSGEDGRVGHERDGDGDPRAPVIGRHSAITEVPPPVRRAMRGWRIRVVNSGSGTYARPLVVEGTAIRAFDRPRSSGIGREIRHTIRPIRYSPDSLFATSAKFAKPERRWTAATRARSHRHAAGGELVKLTMITTTSNPAAPRARWSPGMAGLLSGLTTLLE